MLVGFVVQNLCCVMIVDVAFVVIFIVHVLLGRNGSHIKATIVFHLVGCRVIIEAVVGNVEESLENGQSPHSVGGGTHLSSFFH